MNEDTQEAYRTKFSVSLRGDWGRVVGHLGLSREAVAAIEADWRFASIQPTLITRDGQFVVVGFDLVFEPATRSSWIVRTLRQFGRAIRSHANR